ncbi:hypothetical protein ACFU5O_24965 [Streptomyces sp. NPDC057445]|uniref:hypothetical protein n=1 Tax=Streptomyces sp. NPDC057445 TaxID=3346136 RepID=UPI0036A6ED42
MSRTAHHIPSRYDDLGRTWEERHRSSAFRIRALTLHSLRYDRREEVLAASEGRRAVPQLMRTVFAMYFNDRAYRSAGTGFAANRAERAARRAARMRCDAIRRAHRAGADTDLDVPPARHRHGALW